MKYFPADGMIDPSHQVINRDRMSNNQSPKVTVIKGFEGKFKRSNARTYKV